MAYELGYAGGYADAGVEPEPELPVVGGPLWVPDRPALRRSGRATLRLKVTVLAWGSEGGSRARHTAAVATLAQGSGVAPTRVDVGTEICTRHGHAMTRSRTSLRTYVGDPRQNERIALLAVAALVLGSSE